jgi:hypothetical protein
MRFLFTVTLIWLIVLLWAWRRHRADRPDFCLHRDLLAGGLLVVALLAFFWRTLSGDVYQPADGGDLVSFLFPTYRFAAATLQQGVLPLWNPTLYGGAPFVADIQAGFLYLPNLILFWLQPDFAYPVLQQMALGHLAWAGIGTYLLLRTLHFSAAPVARPAALFGALAFMFSDPLLAHLGNLNLIAVLSWLPWVLAAYHRALTTRRWRWIGATALLFATANYAGHAQSSLYIGLAVGIYTVGWAATQPTHAPWRHWRSILLRAAVVALLTALLTAPILLPALQLSRMTERTGYSYQATTAFSLAPTQLIGLLTPGFFGRGPALHWSLWDRVETPFAGVATLLLALGALLMAPADLRRRIWPWLVLAGVGLVTALGVYALLHGWLTWLLPGFGQLRAPARALVLWSLGLSVVAAVGLDLLLRRGQALLAESAGRQWQTILRQGTWVWFALILPLAYLALLLTQENESAFLRASVAALALVLAALAWLGVWAATGGLTAGWWSPMVAAWLLIGLLYFDLSAAGAYTDISEDDPTRGFDHPALFEFLRADPEHFRIDTYTDIRDLWQPSTAALVGLEDVGGIVNPLLPVAWRDQWEAIGARGSAAYNLLNVKYVIVRDGTPLPDGKFELAFDAPNDLAVYRNLGFLPRAWVVHQAKLADDLPSALIQIQAEDFSPRNQVILLNHEEAGATAYSVLPAAPPATPGSARLTAATVNSLRFSVDAPAPGLLVLSEFWYPGRQATVNGTAQPLLHANGNLSAIPIPAGSATVELIFDPLLWHLGLVAAGLGLLAIAALLLRDRHTRRRRRAARISPA